MKSKLAPYEIRITRQLPPMSIAQIDYIKWKYRQELNQIEFIIKDKIKKRENPINMFYLWGELWDDLLYNRERYKITTITSLEKWLINHIDHYIPEDEQCKVYTDFRKELVGGRVYRSRIFDAISDKYFNVCVEKLTFAGISNPLQVATNVFEEVENLHQSFDEDEEQFVHELEWGFKVYCDKERRPKINLKAIQPLLDLACNV